MLILGQDDILSRRAADELFLLHEVLELFHSYTELSKDTVKFYLFYLCCPHSGQSCGLELCAFQAQISKNRFFFVFF